MEFGLRMLLLDTSFLPTGKGKLAQAELAAKRVVLRGRDAEENSNERVPYRPVPVPVPVPVPAPVPAPVPVPVPMPMPVPVPVPVPVFGCVGQMRCARVCVG